MMIFGAFGNPSAENVDPLLMQFLGHNEKYNYFSLSGCQSTSQYSIFRFIYVHIEN